MPTRRQDRRRARPWSPLAIAWALLSFGCTLAGPDYQAPTLPAPTTWQTPPVAGAAGPNAASDLANWWRTLGDATLDTLMVTAAANNPDLRAAAARVREARARRGIAAADQYPSLAGNASNSRRGSSKQTSSGAVSDLYSANFDARWELDLFGGKRRTLEASQAALAAARWDSRDLLTSLLAEVARNYLDLRTFQTRLAITRENLAVQQATLDIARWRAEAGLVTDLDVAQARSNLEQTRALLPALQSGQQRAINRLAVLLGRAPGALDARLLTALEKDGAIPLPPHHVAVGIPADLLRQRPDVRRAERQLAEQTARIGVARAARYPSLTLSGSIGVESLDSSNLFVSSAQAWARSLGIAWTLFDAGRLRQNVRVQEALRDQSLARYEGTLLTALQEVEDALVDYAQEQTRRASLTSARQAAATAHDLALDQYAAGLVDFQAVLDSQRSLLTVSDQLAQSDAQVTANFIRLYKALGGGWQPITVSPADATQIPAKPVPDNADD